MVESIQSGVLYGFAAQVDGMIERILEELGEATVIATGGLAGLIAPHTKHVQHVEPWLTLTDCVSFMNGIIRETIRDSAVFIRP